MKSKVKEFIFKQYNMGPGLGIAKDTFGRAMTYQAPVTLFLMLLTAYNTMMLREELRHITQWFNFTYFAGAVAFLILLLMLFVWKVEIPSSVRFGNLMNFIHHNLIKELIEDSERRQIEKLKAMERRQIKRFQSVEQVLREIRGKINAN